MSSSQLYQKKLSPLHGAGWFATTDIVTGTGILTERGAWSIPSSMISKDEELVKTFGNINNEKQETILALSSGVETGNDGFKSICQASGTDGAKRLREICMRNCVVGVDAGSVTLCLEIAKINHSCCPNAEIVPNKEEQSVMEIVAIKDIREGEEITVTYCLPYETSIERRQELWTVYGFVCTCRLCSMCIDCVKRSDTRRLLLEKGARVLSEYMETVPELMKPLSPVGDIASVQTKQRHTASTIALHMVRQMEQWVCEEGIGGAEVTKIWRQGWHAAWALGEKDDSKKYLRKLLDEGRRAHVVDDEETVLLSEMMLFLVNGT